MGGWLPPPYKLPTAPSHPAPALGAVTLLLPWPSQETAGAATPSSRLPPRRAPSWRAEPRGPELEQATIAVLLAVTAKSHPALHAQLLDNRDHLRVHAPLQRGAGAPGAVVPITVVIDRGGDALPTPLIRLDRARMQRMFLAMLALQPQEDRQAGS